MASVHTYEDRTVILARFLQRSEAAPRWSQNWSVAYGIGSVLHFGTVWTGINCSAWQGTRTWNHWDGTDIQSFSVSQGKSFGSGKLEVVDVFKNGRESLWDATLNKPVPQLILILVSDWAQKIFLCSIGGQHPSRCFRDLLIRSLLFSRKWPQ